MREREMERGREGGKEREVCLIVVNYTHTVHAFYRKCVKEIGVWIMTCSADAACEQLHCNCIKFSINLHVYHKVHVHKVP